MCIILEKSLNISETLPYLHNENELILEEIMYLKEASKMAWHRIGAQ
jgi:hypothetical protein